MSQNSIIVVDDDPAMRRLLKVNLRALGYEILEAENGVKAKEQVVTLQPRYVITDIDMPEMDGLELTRQLRNAKLPFFVWIVVISGCATADQVKTALSSGANDFLCKPFHITELVERLKRGAKYVNL